ncbi:hypothetical protein ZWY2020_055199 [Hordeum vulgare]|nr:hypothetical protein ZWY2020_055199 [Hordeum vulgare]
MGIDPVDDKNLRPELSAGEGDPFLPPVEGILPAPAQPVETTEAVVITPDAASSLSAEAEIGLRRRAPAAMEGVINNGSQQQMHAPQVPPLMQVHEHMRGAQSWMMTALMANTAANLIITMILLSRM